MKRHNIKHLFHRILCYFFGHCFVRSHPDDLARCVHCNELDYNNEHP